MSDWTFAYDEKEYGGSCADALSIYFGREYDPLHTTEYCCTSCHEDWNYGYDAGSEVAKDGKWYQVCCAVSLILIPETP